MLLVPEMEESHRLPFSDCSPHTDARAVSSWVAFTSQGVPTGFSGECSDRPGRGLEEKDHHFLNHLLEESENKRPS